MNKYVTILTLLLGYVMSSLKFKLEPSRERCYIEELYDESILIVKWKLTGIDETNAQRFQHILGSIHITVKNDGGNIIYIEESPKNLKGKLSYKSSEEGTYKICVRMDSTWSNPREEILMGIKLYSDNADEPELKNAIKSEELNDMQKNVQVILQLGRNINERQSREISEEDRMAQLQLKSGNKFYYMCIVQVILVSLVGIYQLISFRKFLVSQNII